MTDITVYHTTSPEVADLIEQAGFKDATGNYLTRNEYTGVWIGNTIHGPGDGLGGDGAVLCLVIPEALIADYEWIEEWKTHREWLVPADILNQYQITRLEGDL